MAQKDFSSFVPVRRCERQWSDRIRILELPLISGYVFCRFSLQHRAVVLATPGITGAVGFGSGPAAIPNDEIDALMMAARSGLPAEPWPELPLGCPVRIVAGPLLGARGRFTERAGAKLILTVSLLNRSVAVKVDPAWVSRDDRPGPASATPLRSRRAA